MKLTITIADTDGKWLEAGTRLRDIAKAIGSANKVKSACGIWAGNVGTVTAFVRIDGEEQ